MHLNFSQLAFQLANAEGTIRFCKEKGLLADEMICSKCGNDECNWTKRNHTTDIFAWRCNKRSCRSFISIRSGTIFEKSRLEISQIIKLIYLWSYEMATYQTVHRECGIVSCSTVTEWKHLLRDICANYLNRNPRKIGGAGHTVEINESLFNHRKYNVDNLVEPLWIFGGYDPDDGEGFLRTVPDREAETLLPLIKQYILPATTVVSDSWKAYNSLGEEGYQHVTVKHSLNFVERMWKEAKQRSKKECGTSRRLLDSYLTEFMWRQEFGTYPFASILSQIADLYTLQRIPYTSSSTPSSSCVLSKDIKPEPITNNHHKKIKNEY